ncbi:MAG TPA: CHRD domain-containing protein [Aestuariivirga sp.]|nr:CHRD domain-containing protein [Aestuariivirga sp.]
MNRTLSKLVFAGVTSIALMTFPVSAETLVFKADMKGATEVPPNDSAGTGTAEVKVDTETKQMTWTASQSGLSGDPTAAHFHGPAAPGENAPPVVDITGKIESGSADLTDVQLADLQAGKLYINIHTAKFPDGEVRGQVVK